MGGGVKIRMPDRYLRSECADLDRGNQAPDPREIKMQKTILTILGSALLVASTVQFAAAEHHKAHTAYRTPAPESETLRNSNAYNYARPTPWVQPDWSSRYENGAASAPAGH